MIDKSSARCSLVLSRLSHNNVTKPSFHFFFFTLQYYIGSATHQHESVPHPEPPSPPPPCTILLGHPSAPAPRILYWTWTGDSFLMWYYTCFHDIPPNHPTLSLSQSPKNCSIHLCLFCCLAYRVTTNATWETPMIALLLLLLSHVSHVQLCGTP